MFLLSLVLEPFFDQIETYTYQDVWLKLWRPSVHNGLKKPPEKSTSGIYLFTSAKSEHQTQSTSPFLRLVKALKAHLGRMLNPKTHREHMDQIGALHPWAQIRQAATQN